MIFLRYRMKAIKRKFEQYFKNWDIKLPDESIAGRSPGLIRQAGWSIKYIFGKEDGREYLEFYAMHRMTDDIHMKIYDDGKSVELDEISSGYCFDPDRPGDEGRAKSETIKRNRRTYKELQKKGLDMMSVNTYLSLNEVPPPDKK